MRSVRTALAGVLCLLLLAACGPNAGGGGEGGDAVDMSLSDAIGSLKTAPEKRSGYERDKFKLWTDEDGDGCNTRNEVLIAEAVKAPKQGAGCKLSGGEWKSYYDDKTWDDPADLDIDHLVPLAEAWDSGASEWTAKQREQYANDLGDDRDLVAVTDNLNQEKADQDPAEWMPPLESARCRYVSEWVAVKIRWRLTADDKEKSALEKYADGCDETVKVTRAI